jgi:hypothetical protein
MNSSGYKTSDDVMVKVEVPEVLTLVAEALTAVLEQQTEVIALVREIREDRPKPPGRLPGETSDQYDLRLGRWWRSIT